MEQLSVDHKNICYVREMEHATHSAALNRTVTAPTVPFFNYSIVSMYTL